MNRRGLLASVGAVCIMPRALAQGVQKAPEPRVVGILSPNPPLPPDHPNVLAAEAKLRQHGWTLGENLRLERPNAEGREERLPALAEELVRKRVDVIWAIGSEAAVAAARATQTIPIVFWGAPWPVEQGLVESFARPGRNVTGIAFSAGSEAQKVLELMREIAPKAARLAHITTPSAMRTVDGGTIESAQTSMNTAAEKLDFEMRRFEVARVEDFAQVFAAVMTWHAQALYVPGTTLTFRERRRFVEFANRNGLPSGFTQFQFADAGGLFSYGIDSMRTILQSFEHVDRILRGARAADLPVQLPQHFQFVVNRRTANALGLSLPQALLLRADRVIE